MGQDSSSEDFSLEVIDFGPSKDEEIIAESFVNYIGEQAKDYLLVQGVLSTVVFIYTEEKHVHQAAIDDSSYRRLTMSFYALEQEYSTCRAYCLVKTVKFLATDVDDPPTNEEILEYGSDFISVQLLTRDGRFWIWNQPFEKDGDEYIFDREPDLISHHSPNSDVIRTAFDPWRESGPGVLS